MRKAVLLAAASLTLLAFDCGGHDTSTPGPTPLGTCQVAIRGAVSEDLWCFASAVDYSALPGSTSTQWALQIAAYRGSPLSPTAALPDPAAQIAFFLPARPSLGQTYGWSATTSNVESGTASRWVGSVQGGTPQLTHEAMSLGAGYDGTGSLAAQLTAIPPASATDAELLDVHGTIDASAPAVDPAGASITLHAVF